MYHDMTKILSPGERGSFQIEYFEVRDDDFRSIFQGIYPGQYVMLTDHGEVVMSNTPMEQRTNYEFCRTAHGDVLIGGLGIGMILLAIQDKEDVKSITVLEKYQDVIDLVASQLPLNDKVHIITADVKEWRPAKGQKFDCIYMDIWNYINKSVYQNEMKPLKRKWGHYLKPLSESPKRFNRCWAEWQAKNGCSL